MKTIHFRNLSIVLSMFLWVGGLLSQTTPEGLSDEQVMEAVLKAKAENKVDEALKLLSRELDRRGRGDGYFKGLSDRVWNEAQVGGGRLDQDWAALLYDAIFTSARKNNVYTEMNSVIGNLLATLSNAGRHGRLTEVLEWWAEGRRVGGQILETTSYPDLGPVYPFLPEVRKRAIPDELLYARIGIKPEADKSEMVNVEQNNVHVYRLYADHLANAGRWRQSMEWTLQVRRWGSKEDGSPRWQVIQGWFGSVQATAHWFDWHGFTEEALAQVELGLAAPMQKSYHGRCNITFSLYRLGLLMDLGRAPEDVVQQARDLAKRAEENIHLSVGAHYDAKVVVAKALIHKGADAEGMALLDELADKGVVGARHARLQHWLDKGKLDRVEKELLALLKESRASGNKYAEGWLYEKYADFLEASGRLPEALSMRREVIRLNQCFDHFTNVPIQLAKLAVLLERMGDLVGAKAAAEKARQLMAQGTFPASRKALADGVLAKLNPTKPVVAVKLEKQPKVDFQPELSTVIPIEGASWTTMLTLTNPADKVEEGTLSYLGMPMTLTKEADDVVLRPAIAANKGEASLPLRLEPKVYQLIKVTADQKNTQKGELTLIWTSKESRVEAKVRIEAPEKGVSGSVIQAGSYRDNPFYGVPVHLHYVTIDKAAKALPMRFVTTQKARVEVYALDDTPLSVDGQGNGSLRDKGDELFGASDREGNLLLSLKNGTASFKVVIYPSGPLPKEGLTLKVEAYQGGAWALHSQNQLRP